MLPNQPNLLHVTLRLFPLTPTLSRWVRGKYGMHLRTCQIKISFRKCKRVKKRRLLAVPSVINVLIQRPDFRSGRKSMEGVAFGLVCELCPPGESYLESDTFQTFAIVFGYAIGKIDRVPVVVAELTALLEECRPGGIGCDIDGGNRAIWFAEICGSYECFESFQPDGLGKGVADKIGIGFLRPLRRTQTEHDFVVLIEDGPYEIFVALVLRLQAAEEDSDSFFLDAGHGKRGSLIMLLA